MSRIWTVKNLPPPGSACLKAKVAPAGDVMVTNAEGWIVAELRAHSPQHLADEIARAIEDARDAGFQQGLAHVRRALGIT